MALRWESTHVTKHCPRVVLLQEGLGDTGGAQVIPPPREVQVPSELDRVPWTGHLGEQGQDGPC